MSRENGYITASTSVDGPVAGSRAGKLQKCKSTSGASVVGAGGLHTQKWEGETP